MPILSVIPIRVGLVPLNCSVRFGEMDILSHQPFVGFTTSLSGFVSSLLRKIEVCSLQLYLERFGSIRLIDVNAAYRSTLVSPLGDLGSTFLLELSFDSVGLQISVKDARPVLDLWHILSTLD